MSQIEILPESNKANQTLIDLVRPSGWTNPQPSGRYNLIVIGGGSAGLTAARGAAILGAKVALIEKGYLGGDCLITGCIPSKALIRTARAAHAVREAPLYGVSTSSPEIDFSAALDRMRQVRADIAPHDSAAALAQLGVDLYFGTAQFIGSDQLEVAGETLRFAKALIATGSHPAVLPLPGLNEAGFLTNETIFNLNERPNRLAIMGAGPIGTELAQAFQRLGSQVTLIDLANRVLPREEKEASDLVAARLRAEGVELYLGYKTERVTVSDGKKRLHLRKIEQQTEGVGLNQLDNSDLIVAADDILLAIGRRPNVDRLGLAQAGVNTTPGGTIEVNDLLQTTNPNIYAAGDVASPYQFTHVAGHAGAIVVQNALFPFPKRRMSDLVIPWVTYTDPEIAHVGLYPHETNAAGIKIDRYRASMSENDRAITEDDTAGFIYIDTRQGSDEILGATIVSRHAGDLINEISVAMKHKIGLGGLGSIVRPYPTQAELINRVAIQYNRTRLTPRVQKLFNWWFKQSRGNRL